MFILKTFYDLISHLSITKSSHMTSQGSLKPAHAPITPNWPSSSNREIAEDYVQN